MNKMEKIDLDIKKLNIYNLPEQMLYQIINYGYLGDRDMAIWLNLHIDKILEILGKHDICYSRYMSGLRFIDESRLSTEVKPGNLSIMKMNALINRYNKNIPDIDYVCSDNKDIGEFILLTYQKCSDKLMLYDGSIRLFFDIIIPYKVYQMNMKHNIYSHLLGFEPRYYESVLSEIYTTLVSMIHSKHKNTPEISNAIPVLYSGFRRLVSNNTRTEKIIDTLFSKYLSLYGCDSISVTRMIYRASEIPFNIDDDDYIIKECAKYITHDDNVDRFEGEYYTESVYEHDEYRIKGITLYCKESTNINENEIVFNLRLIQDEFTESELHIPQEKLRLLSEQGEIIPCVSENQNVMKSCVLFEYDSDIYLLYNSFDNICGQSLINDSTIDLL